MSKLCIACGVEFVLKVGKNYTTKQKYCSVKCRSKIYYTKYYTHFAWKKEKPCEMCGNTYLPLKPVSYTCSRKCCMKRNRLVCKESKREYDRVWQTEDRKNNPDKYRMRTRLRNYLIRMSGAPSGKKFNSEFSKDDWEDIKKKFQYTCPACLRKEPEIKLTLDHIIPLSKGGWHDSDNFQPLCHSCNSRKKDKTEFYPARKQELVTLTV